MKKQYIDKSDMVADYMGNKKKNANKFTDRLRIIDEKLGDFEDNAIPKVLIDEYD